jgi:hypothetical protein
VGFKGSVALSKKDTTLSKRLTLTTLLFCGLMLHYLLASQLNELVGLINRLKIAIKTTTGTIRVVTVNKMIIKSNWQGNGSTKIILFY